MNSRISRQAAWLAANVRKLAFVLAVLVSVLQIPTFAQTSTVYGTITDRNGKPVVNILAVIGPNYRYTDVSGSCKIVGVPQGRQHMVCRHGSTILWPGDVDIANEAMVLNRQLK